MGKLSSISISFNMKKFLVIIFIIVSLVTISWIGFFYYKNLRGLKPAVLRLPKDITKVLPDKPLKKQEFLEAINKTDFPLNLPAGFSISIFAKNLGKPRVIIDNPTGGLLASLTSAGRVVALPDNNSDGVADGVVTVIENLNRPHGLATKCNADFCKLYIAETNGVRVYDFDKENLKATNGKKIIDLPAGGRHYTRTMMFSPKDSDKLLISVGSSCDTCYEDDFKRASILIANSDGSDLKTFASGLRNSVFMATHPITQEIWATEMGRDFLGDDLPPDEINIIKDGGNYGWPICYGKNIHDTKFDKKVYIRNPCEEPLEIPSHIDIPAHSSPLGLAFVPKEGWPEQYQYNLFVAYHGSWNRSIPTGYKIVRYKLDAQGNYLGEEDFITGWLTSDYKSLGRPVGVLIQPGGVMYISDDKAGVVYRVENFR